MDPYSYESLAVDIKVVQLEGFGQSATLVCIRHRVYPIYTWCYPQEICTPGGPLWFLNLCTGNNSLWFVWLVVAPWGSGAEDRLYGSPYQWPRSHLLTHLPLSAIQYQLEFCWFFSTPHTPAAAKEKEKILWLNFPPTIASTPLTVWSQ